MGRTGARGVGRGLMKAVLLDDMGPRVIAFVGARVAATRPVGSALDRKCGGRPITRARPLRHEGACRDAARRA